MQTPTSRLSSQPTSRRAVLRAALGLAGIGVVSASALSGCDLFSGTETAAPPTPELNGLLTHTVALGHQYDATITAVPDLATKLTPLRDAHRAHADAIAAAIGVEVPAAADGSPPPSDRKAALAALAAAEKAGQSEALAACLSGSARVAPLLGSIAAARASHQEVLV